MSLTSEAIHHQVSHHLRVQGLGGLSMLPDLSHQAHKSSLFITLFIVSHGFLHPAGSHYAAEAITGQHHGYRALSKQELRNVTLLNLSYTFDKYLQRRF